MVTFAPTAVRVQLNEEGLANFTSEPLRARQGLAISTSETLRAQSIDTTSGGKVGEDTPRLPQLGEEEEIQGGRSLADSKATKADDVEVPIHYWDEHIWDLGLRSDAAVYVYEQWCGKSPLLA
jgi:hypothetical protein